MVLEEDLKNGDFICVREDNKNQYYIYYSFTFISLDSSASKRLDLTENENRKTTYLGNYHCSEVFDDTTAQFHQFRQWFWKNHVKKVNINDETIIIALIESLVLSKNVTDCKSKERLKL